MPTYEYRCPKGHEFEHFVLRISEAQSSMRCPTCGEAAERRISAGGGLLFKGSGFYITDYGKDGKKDLRTNAAAAAASESTGATGSTPSESKPASDSKPAEKADPKPAAKAEAKPAPPAAPSKPDK